MRAGMIPGIPSSDDFWAVLAYAKNRMMMMSYAEPVVIRLVKSKVK